MILSSRKKLLDNITFSMLVDQTMTLLHYMKEHKIEIRDLAEKAKVTEAYISAIRHGHRRPSPDVAKRISDAIGINVLDLLFPEEERRESDVERATEVSN
jgi:transcriptional regulator with XRE-family HTH domain